MLWMVAAGACAEEVAEGVSEPMAGLYPLKRMVVSVGPVEMRVRMRVMMVIVRFVGMRPVRVVVRGVATIAPSRVRAPAPADLAIATGDQAQGDDNRDDHRTDSTHDFFLGADGPILRLSAASSSSSGSAERAVFFVWPVCPACPVGGALGFGVVPERRFRSASASSIEGPGVERVVSA
jgi:hypothetical protein